MQAPAALLLGQADAAVGPVDRLAACFEDHRDGRFVEHSVRTLAGQRVFGIALGYEDSIDRDALRDDPMMPVLAGKLRAKRRNCAPVAGKSTPNRLGLDGLSPSGGSKIVHDGSAIIDDAARFDDIVDRLATNAADLERRVASFEGAAQ